jgi:hypothetical protein
MSLEMSPRIESDRKSRPTLRTAESDEGQRHGRAHRHEEAGHAARYGFGLDGERAGARAASRTLSDDRGSRFPIPDFSGNASLGHGYRADLDLVPRNGAVD